MFGPDDAFLNALAAIIRSSPVIPLVGGGRTRLQPVHVLDVAEAVHRVMADPAAPGTTYELGGETRPTLREIVALIAVRLGRGPLILPLPFTLARPAARIFELLPHGPLTVAQVDLLESDNLVSAQLPGLEALGITPRRLADAIAALPCQ
jgi:NADH dehydrogenase